MLSMLTTAIAVIALLITMSVFFRKVPPQYVPVRNDGTLLPLQPITEPNADDATIMAYAVKVVHGVSTYDYISYRRQMANAQSLFMVDAWNTFVDKFMETSTIKAVEAKKMVVYFTSTGPSAVVRQGNNPRNGNIYTWVVEIPGEIAYIAHNTTGNEQSNKQVGLARVTIERVPNTVAQSGYLASAYSFLLKDDIDAEKRNQGTPPASPPPPPSGAEPSAPPPAQ